MDYRLLRLILIDSYSPGRVVEFPLEGGAVLTGRNGRGKTTLLQLLPIFYTRAMEEAGPMAEVMERETRLTAIEAELGRIHSRVLRLLAHLEEYDAENRRQRARQASEARLEEQAHRQTAEGIRIRQETAGREAKDQEGRVAALDAQHADWLRRDLPGKAALLQREPELRNRLGQLHQRREALLGEQQRISLQYERLFNDLDRRHTLAETAAADARTALYQGFEPRLNALDTEARTDLAGLRETHSTELRALDARLQKTLERKGECSKLARAPQPDPVLVAIRDAKQAAANALGSEREIANQADRQCREALVKVKAADLERVSSNGLSYLILCVIFIACIERIRRQASGEVVWAPRRAQGPGHRQH